MEGSPRDCIRTLKFRYFEQCLDEIYRPAIEKEKELFEKAHKECEEYSKLVFTCQRLLKDCGKTVEARVDLGMKVYMNAEVRDPKHVIVKMAEDIFVEMKLNDAVKFGEKKISFLKNIMSKSQNRINDINVEINLVFANLDVETIG